MGSLPFSFSFAVLSCLALHYHLVSQVSTTGCLGMLLSFFTIDIVSIIVIILLLQR
ncbi:hypothetical protein F5X96DRAFT_627299 [Biscogniauxia mediterranea]|nr:hypothetical protein F5X96DRAFT_627299 [Biscogniauxia mediterranea]